MGLCRVPKTWEWRGEKKKHPNIGVPRLKLMAEKGDRRQNPAHTWGKFINLLRFTVLLSFHKDGIRHNNPVS